MASSKKELLGKVYKMVPPMLEKFHKGGFLCLLLSLWLTALVGQLGRVAVIGGCEDYTGAPTFSALASAKLGCDMSHIICEPGAGAVIKTYSPNLMVHPYIRQSFNMGPQDSVDSCSKKVIDMLGRLHVLVIGPGLGRDQAMQDTCRNVLRAAREKKIPFVLDADGLMIATQHPEVVKGYRECILTPNVVEFGRLAEAMGVDQKGDPTKLCEQLAEAFGGVTIIQKGAKDYISNGTITLVNDSEGGLKRSGGQGDTLTGALATLLAYRTAYLEKLWDHEADMSAEELMGIVAYGGSAITRECSRLAYLEKGRSLQASDLTEHVHTAFMNLIGEKTGLSKF
ncbi:hypothetical protein FH972_024232 [Carpinus fangiana]|uniref:ATP-dependent (S)-NAD(P)H-hydrate dehydratase n=1 Tax=Carpinus fangiana TaxID=176857 RepID=A0A5N6KXU0_9ROSI|nr:hypothetical protein FH972_024232 [Carpinus fangiana]